MSEEVSRLVLLDEFDETDNGNFVSGYFIIVNNIDSPFSYICGENKYIAMVIRDDENVITGFYHFSHYVVTETYDNYHIHFLFPERFALPRFIGSLGKEDYLIKHYDKGNDVYYEEQTSPMFINRGTNEIAFMKENTISVIKFQGGQVNNLVDMRIGFMYDKINSILVSEDSRIYYLNKLVIGEDIIMTEDGNIELPLKEGEDWGEIFYEFIHRIDKLYQYNIVTAKDGDLVLTDAKSIPIGKTLV